MEWLWLVPIVLVIGVILFFLWRPLRSLGKDIQVERARESFLLQRERLEAKFVTAAAATGKPRGLRWKDCSFEALQESLRARDGGEMIAWAYEGLRHLQGRGRSSLGYSRESPQ